MPIAAMQRITASARRRTGPARNGVTTTTTASESRPPRDCVRNSATDVTSTTDPSTQRQIGDAVTAKRKAPITIAGTSIAASSFGSLIPPLSREASA